MERLEEFADAHLRPTIKEPLPSLLPYRNMVIHYNDSLEWYLSVDVNNSLTLANCFFRPDTLKSLNYGSQPQLAIFNKIRQGNSQFYGRATSFTRNKNNWNLTIVVGDQKAHCYLKKAMMKFLII